MLHPSSWLCLTLPCTSNMGLPAISGNPGEAPPRPCRILEEAERARVWSVQGQMSAASPPACTPLQAFQCGLRLLCQAHSGSAAREFLEHLGMSNASAEGQISVVMIW